MGIEDERKFLVHLDRLPELLAGTHMTQGYLSYKPAIRARVEQPDGGNRSAVLTVKLPKQVGKRGVPEFNYDIPLGDGLEMQAACGPLINKTRFRVGRWEIDKFHDHLSGLWLAEFELDYEGEVIDLPSWVRREVTDDSRYSNANLVRYGIPDDYLS